MIRKKRNFFARAIFNPKTLSFLGLIVIVAISFPISKSISKKYKIDQEILELEKEIEAMEGANSDFKKMLTYLESDSFVEEQARLNLSLKKQGEKVVVIEDISQEEANGEIGPSSQRIGEFQNFNLLAWCDYFFSKKRK